MKKFTKPLVCVILIVITALVCCACGQPADKTYEEEGFKITMPSGFYSKELASVTYYFEKKDAIVTALKEEFTVLEQVADINAQSTEKEYAELVKANNIGINTSDVKTADNGVIYFTYENSVNGKDFYYTAVITKGSDAFWLCNFACVLSDKDEFAQEFIDWAATIEVK